MERPNFGDRYRSKKTGEKAVYVGIHWGTSHDGTYRREEHFGLSTESDPYPSFYSIEELYEKFERVEPKGGFTYTDIDPALKAAQENAMQHFAEKWMKGE